MSADGTATDVPLRPPLALNMTVAQPGKRDSMKLDIPAEGGDETFAAAPAEAGDPEPSWRETFSSWRDLFQALADSVDAPDEVKKSSLGTFIAATKLSAKEDGINLTRSMQHASRLGLVRKDRQDACRKVASCQDFQVLVVERWGESDKEKGAKQVLKDMEFTVWRLSEERIKNEAQYHQWKTYCTLVAFCCSLAGLWEIDLGDFDDPSEDQGGKSIFLGAEDQPKKEGDNKKADARKEGV